MQEIVVNAIDDNDYMLLSKSTTPHSDLFLYAFALGWSKKLNPKMDKPSSGGFIRSESFSPKLSTLIETVHYAIVGFDSPDELRNHKESFRIAEQYANGGFHLLEGDVERNAETETTANELIAEMNAKWSDLFDNEEH